MEKDPNSYQFMDETIKTLPPDRKKIAWRILLICAGALLFGAIAACVFAWLEPRMQDYFYPPAPAQVLIPEDEEPIPEPEATESAVSEEADGTEESADTEETESAGKQEEEKTQPVTEQITVVQELTLADYQKLQEEMFQIAQTLKYSMVQVIGISNQMDYFNRTYENQKEISGLIVADNGSELFILTEYRVVKNVERIQVTFWDSAMVDAIFQKYDPNTGLAILKVDEQLLSKETYEGVVLPDLGNSYGVTQGTLVMALGSPNGYSESVSLGNVTASTNMISLYDTTYSVLNTDIMGSTDGSGILINVHGSVVGIILQEFSPSGQETVTALAISQLKPLIQNLSNNISQPFLGIRGQDVTSEISGHTGVPIGVIVNRLAVDSPAMLAGIKEADVIVKLGEEKISGMADYKKALSKYQAGDTVTITAMRKGAEGYVEVAFEDVTVSTRE